MTDSILCTVAVVMAGTSLLLQLGSAIAQSNTADSITPTQADEAKLPTASLKLSHKELRTLAQALKVGSGYWRSRAKKSELVIAIREHNQARTGRAA